MADPPVTSAMMDVLALLLQAWEDKAEVHGWRIMKSVRRSGPTVYRVLDRLEDAGWVTGSWEELAPEERRPRRRFYRLTAQGAEAARQQLAVPAPAARRGFRAQPGFGRIGLLRPAR